MNKHVVRGLIAVAGFASAVSVVNAQGAPTSAQVWDVRFIVDDSGPFAQGPSATAVGITLVARVGILPNTSPIGGSTNFGVGRVGGAGTATSGFRVTFSDALSAGLGLNQGVVQRGVTAQAPQATSAEDRNDANGSFPAEGAPLSGAFYAFRDGFSVPGLPNPGSNNDPFNGSYTNPATGSPVYAGLTISRGRGWNTVPTPLGVATLDGAGNIIGGDYAPIYRLIYIPREDFTDQAVRNITVTAQGMTARYIFDVQGDAGLTSSANFNIPAITFSFQVPGPGAAALMGLAGIAALRRRRA